MALSSAGAATQRRGSHPFHAIPKPKRSCALRAPTAPRCSLETVSLQCGATTVRIPVPTAQVATLATAVNNLLKTFAEKQKPGAARRWDPVECKIAGDPAQGELPLIELFCNPNAHATMLDAKVLVTLRSGEGLQVVTEATLEQVRAGVKDALVAVKEKAAAA